MGNTNYDFSKLLRTILFFFYLMNNDHIFIFDNLQCQPYENSMDDYDLPHCDPYLEKGDSIRYVDQFLT